MATLKNGKLVTYCQLWQRIDNANRQMTNARNQADFDYYKNLKEELIKEQEAAKS